MIYTYLQIYTVSSKNLTLSIQYVYELFYYLLRRLSPKRVQI